MNSLGGPGRAASSSELGRWWWWWWPFGELQGTYEVLALKVTSKLGGLGSRVVVCF